MLSMIMILGTFAGCGNIVPCLAAYRAQLDNETSKRKDHPKGWSFLL